MSKVFDIAFKLGAELTSSFTSAFSQADSTMSKLSAAAIAFGGGALLTGAVTQVAEMSDSLAKLSAQTGTYGADMTELGDVAKNVFKAGHGESFSDVTTALMEVKNHMHNLDDGELERVTGNAMMLANTFDAEVNEVTRAANNLITNFGMDSEKAFDMMAKGAQNGLNFSGELFDNLSEYSPLWADMGYSAEEMFGILQSGAKEGVYNLDYINDAMKEFQIRATDGSKSTLDAVAQLGPETQKVWEAFSDGEATVADMSQAAVAELAKIDDKVKQNELGVALFGTKWEDLSGDVVLSMLTAGESLEDFEGTMAKINEVRFDTVGAAIRGIGRILLVDLVAPIGEAVLPYLNDFATFLANNLPSAIDKMKSIFQTVAPVLLGLVAAFAAYRTILFVTMAAQAVYNAVLATSTLLYTAHRGAMIAYALAGGGLRGVLAALAAAQTVLNITMLANPIAAVIATVVGLGVAFYAAYKMSDRFREAVNNAFSAVVSFVDSAASYVASQAHRIWSGLLAGAGSIGSIISGAVSGIGELIVGVIGEELAGKAGGVLNGFVETLKVGFVSLPGIVSLVAPTVAALGLAFLGVSAPVTAVIAGVVSLVGFLYRLSQTNSTVAAAFASAWQSLQTVFAPVLDVLSAGIAQFAAEVGPQLQQTMLVISQSIAALGPSFAQLGATLAQLATMIISLWSQVGSSILNLAVTVLPLLMQTVQMILPMIVGILMAVLPVVIQLISSIVPVILQIAQMILPMLLMAVQMIFPLILSIIQMVLPIVITLLTTVVSIVLQIAQMALPILLQIVQMVFPIIVSIIQMTVPIIAAILQVLVGIINGVLIPAINGILAVVQMVFPMVQAIITTALAIINGIITAAMALLRGDWDGAWNAILSTATTIMNNIISFFSSIDLYSVGVAIINGLINGIKSMAGAIGGAISSLIPAPLKSAVSGVIGAIPGFAKGGVVSSPTLAWIGEGGDTETIIPHNNAARSKALWVGAGHALGMFDAMKGQGQDPSAAFGSVKLPQQQTTASPFAVNVADVRPAAPATTSGQTIIEFKPTYHITGGNIEDIQRMLDARDRELMDKLEQLQRDGKRVAFS